MRKYEAIRTEIKKLSDSQRTLKPLRKRNQGLSSTMVSGITCEEAVWVVIKNKYELKHLFQAYAILKGIERPVVKRPGVYGHLVNEKKVQDMVEKYRPVEVVEEI